MMRRFSSKVGFNKDQKQSKTDPAKATNGTVNGTSNGAPEKPGISKRNTIFSQKPKQESVGHAPSTKREDIEYTFKQFAQLVQATRRPIPTQTGDGTYVEHVENPGMFSDLSNLGFKDARTLMDVMKTKAAGGLTDDRTYLMEKVIQVCFKTCFVLESKN